MLKLVTRLREFYYVGSLHLFGKLVTCCVIWDGLGWRLHLMLRLATYCLFEFCHAENLYLILKLVICYVIGNGLRPVPFLMLLLGICCLCATYPVMNWLAIYCRASEDAQGHRLLMLMICSEIGTALPMLRLGTYCFCEIDLVENLCLMLKLAICCACRTDAQSQHFVMLMTYSATGSVLGQPLLLMPRLATYYLCGLWCRRNLRVAPKLVNCSPIENALGWHLLLICASEHAENLLLMLKRVIYCAFGHA